MCAECSWGTKLKNRGAAGEFKMSAYSRGCSQNVLCLKLCCRATANTWSVPIRRIVLRSDSEHFGIGTPLSASFKRQKMGAHSMPLLSVVRGVLFSAAEFFSGRRNFLLIVSQQALACALTNFSALTKSWWANFGECQGDIGNRSYLPSIIVGFGYFTSSTVA